MIGLTNNLSIPFFSLFTIFFFRKSLYSELGNRV